MLLHISNNLSPSERTPPDVPWLRRHHFLQKALSACKQKKGRQNADSNPPRMPLRENKRRRRGKCKSQKHRAETSKTTPVRLVRCTAVPSLLHLIARISRMSASVFSIIEEIWAFVKAFFVLY
ncbi:MAG: hypothetical protein ACLSD3_13665 [Acutalibacteraceae bacterium]